VTSIEPLDSYFTTKRGRALLTQLAPSRVPAHVAVIMDGNGRWAKRRGLPRLAGHKAGAAAVRELIGTSIELGIRYLTVYSFSSENWNRSPEEVSGLMDLFVEVLHRELASLQERHVRVVVIGRMGALPPKTRAAFEECVDQTRANDGLTLVVALNYGGRMEIRDAAVAIAEDVAAGTLRPADIDEEVIDARLYTAGIPDPDLVVRTSGEMRVSNFLLWQIAYSEFYVTEVLWPDFGRDDLLEAVVDFGARERRFGGTS
jgi:undecaprenyl diphosphate synthase